MLRCHKNSRPLFVVQLRHGSVVASGRAHYPILGDFLMTGDAGKGAKMDRAVLLNDITKIASDSLSSLELHLSTVIERIERTAICEICKLYLQLNLI